MANHLPMGKKVAVVAALAEGSSIRSIERMTGVNRNTIMSLGLRVGNGCTELSDVLLRDLPCQRIQLDEIWGFIGKKQANLKTTDDPRFVGDVWTFVSLDADSKLVPAYAVGKRDSYTANNFV